MGDPATGTLLGLALFALKGASSEVGKSVVRIGVSRLETQLLGGSRDQLANAMADSIYDVYRANRPPDSELKEAKAARYQLAKLFKKLGEQGRRGLTSRDPQALGELEAGGQPRGTDLEPATGRLAAHGSTARREQESHWLEQESRWLEREQQWLNPVALWLVALLRGVEEYDGPALPKNRRADLRGFLVDKTRQGLRRILRRKGEEPKKAETAIGQAIRVSLDIPLLPAQNDLKEIDFWFDRLALAEQLRHTKHWEAVNWLATVLDAIQWRLFDNRRLGELVRHLRFDAQQRQWRRMIITLRAAAAALSVLSTSSAVGVIWLLTHWS